MMGALGLHNVDLANTPGIYYAIGYWMACEMFIRLDPHRKKGARYLLTQFAFFAAIVTFMLVTDGIVIWLFIPCILADVSMLIAMAHVSCAIRWREAIYMGGRAFMLGEFTASLGWQLLYYFIVNENRALSLRTNLVIVLPTYLMILGISILLEKLSIRDKGDYQLTWKEIGVLVLIIVVTYTVSNTSYFARNSPFSSRFTWELFLIRTITDLGGVAIVYLYHLILRQYKARMEAENMNRLLELQYANYKLSERSIALVNQKYHDLKHQIALLKSGISDSERRGYLEEIESDIRAYEAQNKTGSQVLDTILTARSLICQRYGIQINTVADGAALSFMKPMDLSAMMGNALDNAIESAQQIPDPSQRLIRLTVSRQKNFVHIQVENRYIGEIRFRNGMPLTSKGDENYHGFGVKSIRSTAEKYGGSMRVTSRDQWFRLNILLPVPPKAK